MPDTPTPDVLPEYVGRQPPAATDPTTVPPATTAVALSPAIESGTPPITGKATPSLEQLHERMSAFEKATIRWTRITVVVSILAAGFVCAQWWEMHTGGRDTHDLAIQAGQQAEQARKQADQTAKLADGMAELASSTTRQAAATNTLALNSGGQLKVMGTQLETADRPWIEVVDVRPDPGKTLEWDVGPQISSDDIPMVTYNSITQVKNVGKSPALDLTAFSQLAVVQNGNINHDLAHVCNPPNYQSFVKPETAPLFPGETREIDIGLLRQFTSEEMYSFNAPDRPDEAYYNTKTVNIYLLECVAYRSQVSLERHVTRIVYRVDKPDGSLWTFGISEPNAPPILRLEPGYTFAN
jgi:hypothetical protein